MKNIDMPPGVKALPIDERGYPIPWFVAWPDGKPDFRIADPKKIHLAIHQKRCWVCGRKLDLERNKSFAFVIGPMCAVNKVSSEPPSHVECAEYSAKACPFLSEPVVKRNERGLPSSVKDPAGVMIMRNPGVTLIWVCKRYELVISSDGVLFDIGKCIKTLWYREGRPATHAEVMDSITSGLPLLKDMAAKEGPEAMQALDLAMIAARELLPEKEMSAQP